jgi:hypothetical protein
MIKLNLITQNNNFVVFGVAKFSIDYVRQRTNHSTHEKIWYNRVFSKIGLLSDKTREKLVTSR